MTEPKDTPPTVEDLSLFADARARGQRDEQTRRADRWMMRYHVAAKQLQDWLQFPQREEAIRALEERTRTLLAAVEQGDDEAKALVDELHRLRRLRKALFENTRWQGRKLDAVYQLAQRWYEETTGATDYGSAMLDVLNSEEGQPFYDDEVLTCSFTWGDDDKIIPENGYGALLDTGEKLTLTFDCGGILACADISYAYLDRVLNKSGRMVALLPQPGSADETAALKKDRDEWQERAQRLADVIEQGTHLTLADGLQAVAEWEKEHGALTDRELVHATRLVKARDHWFNFTTVEDTRVLGALEAIPTRVLAQCADRFPSLVPFVKFELASRVAAAIVDVPWHWDETRIQESSVHDLLDILDSAERYGAELGAMTPEEKKRHYEAWVEGRVDDVTMQIRPVQSDGASEPKPG